MAKEKAANKMLKFLPSYIKPSRIIRVRMDAATLFHAFTLFNTMYTNPVLQTTNFIANSHLGLQLSKYTRMK